MSGGVNLARLRRVLAGALRGASVCAVGSLAGCGEGGEAGAAAEVGELRGATSAENEGGAADHGAKGDWFVEVSSAVGLEFWYGNGATGSYYYVEIIGAGCALFDYDNDGDLDVYFVQGRVLEDGKSWVDGLVQPPPGLEPRGNRLFRNELLGQSGLKGELRFTDVTDAAGVGHDGFGMGVVAADYDNDGDIDLYVTNFGPDVLYRNNGDGTFADVTEDAGLGDPRWNTVATFFDFDGDGLLDLFVGAGGDVRLDDHPVCYRELGRRDYCGPQSFKAIPSRLYRNLDGARFLDVSSAMGISEVQEHTLGAVAADFDEDGRLDLYVANDDDPNQLWLNRGDVFEDVGLIRGAALNALGAAEAGMGVGVADFDDDRDLDLIVTHLYGETNTLYVNDGAFFTDATGPHGVGAPSRRFTGFGVGWFDFDHDSDLDLFIANGDIRAHERENDPSLFPYDQTNQLLLNNGDGRYVEATSEAGPALALSEVSRGAAFGDIDNDGDIDVLVVNSNGRARLFLNEMPKQGAWTQLRVIDGDTGRDALGATVRLGLSDGRTLTRSVRVDGSYLSSNDPRVHFAWPSGVSPVSAEVISISGRRTPLELPKEGAMTTVVVPRAE